MRPTTDDAEDSSETWIREDETYIPDAAALCAQIGALYITRYDGDLYAGIIGQGEVAVANVLAELGEKDRQVRPVTSIQGICTVKPIRGA
jgi:hypothetical protein